MPFLPAYQHHHVLPAVMLLCADCSATNVTDFWSIFGYGRSIQKVVNPVFQYPGSGKSAFDILAETGLYGCPHDVTAAMFGGPNFTANRGPVAMPAVNWNDMLRLQSLFDQGESCYPA